MCETTMLVTNLIAVYSCDEHGQPSVPQPALGPLGPRPHHHQFHIPWGSSFCGSENDTSHMVVVKSLPDRSNIQRWSLVELAVSECGQQQTVNRSLVSLTKFHHRSTWRTWSCMYGDDITREIKRYSRAEPASRYHHQFINNLIRTNAAWTIKFMKKHTQ